MTRKRQKFGAGLRWSLALWAVVLISFTATAAWHIAGWIIATLVLVNLAYFIGRQDVRRGKPAIAAKTLANSRYGKDAERSGAVSAYPAEITSRYERSVTDEVTQALVGLGWKKADTKEPVNRAYATVRDAGTGITTSLVLTTVLREAGRRRGSQIIPE